MVASGKLRLSLVDRLGGWNAALIAGGFYVMAVLMAGLLLPGVDEVPDAFPAVVLWKFRVASVGAQLIMWASIGLLFGALAERLLAPHVSRRPGREAVAV